MTKTTKRAIANIACTLDAVFHLITFPETHGLAKVVSHASSTVINPKVPWILLRKNLFITFIPYKNSPVK